MTETSQHAPGRTGPILDVSDLAVRIPMRHGLAHPVDGVSFHVEAGECLGIVGESGCGKSMTGLALMGLLPSQGYITGGSMRLAGRELVGLSSAQMRSLRGNEVSMIFQDPMTSLNPTKTIGAQVAEPLRIHRDVSRAQALDRAEEVLGLVGLPRPKERLGDYPHQLSGGMRQRVMIAMALACDPKVLIADEPTTALDVTIQAQILELLDDLRERLGMAVLLITHDMGVIAGRTDRVVVMYAGQVVESTTTTDLFLRMRHPYSRALLASIPRLDSDPRQQLPSIPGLPPDLAEPLTGCRFAPRCGNATPECHAREPALTDVGGGHLFACFHPVDGPPPVLPAPEGAAALALDLTPEDPETAFLRVGDIVREFPVSAGGFLGRGEAKSVKAVSDVSLTVQSGTTFGLVGESGCGKTTLGRLITAMDEPDRGSVSIDGEVLGDLSRQELRRKRRQFQLMFQDPYASLDPRMRVGRILREPLIIQGIGEHEEQDRIIQDLLREVGLPPNAVDRYPHEFSGGQRQRIGLARALALRPDLVVADEPVSALDVSVRAQVLNLMKRLQAAHGLTYVVISHDLAVVKYLADRIGVMYLGKLVEVGPAAAVYALPAHPYTASLIEAIPVPSPAKARRSAPIKGEIPSAIDPPSGCRFRTRCPRAQERCAAEEPILAAIGAGAEHTAACHFPLTGEVSPVGVAADQSS
ncbi:MAG TPA: ABC transporter ATP-binding protein [Solirubrobacteraceae bacterium]|nr:ABC transporter ATP-binding protein [Solirubrobacteraceae bacterium]